MEPDEDEVWPCPTSSRGLLFEVGDDDFSEEGLDDDVDDVKASREWLSLQSDFYPENGWTAEVYSETVNTVIIHLTTFIKPARWER